MKRLKLTLSTIRTLTTDDLADVRGGQRKTSEQNACPTDDGKTIVRTSRC